jgi:hypothetical protein
MERDSIMVDMDDLSGVIALAAVGAAVWAIVNRDRQQQRTVNITLPELTGGTGATVPVDDSGQLAGDDPSIPGTIDANLGFGEFGTGGSVSPDAPMRGGLTPYQQELLDTDTGD